ncbi:MAG: hypothetical protein JO041_10460 [Acidobacteria bacterium]|nr:hypothetical protein [Acidobacteriota bacterium]
MKLALALAVAAVAVYCPAQEHRHGASGAALGTVNFPVSCSPAVQADFNHALALLHSFEYDESQAAFLAVAKNDPGCAMADWGAAMSHFHGLWGELENDSGARLAATAREKAAANPKTTAREKQYIEAASAIFGDAENFHARAQRFSEAMARVYESNPGDDEAAIFYALSLDESATPDPTFANRRKCGEILEPVFRRLPNHPGVAHYLIHCYDTDALAAKGLDAARRYARIAPASAHAEHMPSHIFVRLGLWQEVVDSNIASMDAAEKDASASPCERRGNEMHAMHFLQFGYLQQGRLKAAREIAMRARSLPAGKGDCYVTPDYVAASFALDAHDWEFARQVKPGGERDGLTWTALGIASARSGDLTRAREAEKALAAEREVVAKDSPRGPRNSAEVNRLEVAAWIAEQEGDHARAADLMREAAALHDELSWSAWEMPPAREMLADLLLLQGQSEEALAEYRAVLQKSTNLFNAVYGIARSADAAGDQELALAYYRRLAELGGNGDRPEVQAARRRVAGGSASGSGGGW